MASYPTWDVSVVSFEENANAAIADENSFNEPPAAGHVYVLVHLQGTYTGNDFGSVWLDLDYYLVGDTNVTYEKAWVVTPNSLTDLSDTLTGGSVGGNLAFMVPEQTVESLLLLVTDGGLRYADTIGYFSLGQSNGAVNVTPMPVATSEPQATPVATATSIPEQTTTPAIGDRGNPIPLNQMASYPTWDVSVVSFDENANAAIADENPFNEPPADGQVYVLVRLQGTYTGNDFGSVWLDLDYYLVGDTNVTYEKAWVVTPNSLTDLSDTLTGGSVGGNLAFMVPEQTVGSLLLLVTDDGLRYADTIGYFSLR